MGVVVVGVVSVPTFHFEKLATMHSYNQNRVGQKVIKSNIAALAFNGSKLKLLLFFFGKKWVASAINQYSSEPFKNLYKYHTLHCSTS